MKRVFIAVLFALAAAAAFAQDLTTPPVIAASPEAVVAADEATSATIEWGNLIIYWVKGLQVVLVTVLVGGLTWAATWIPGVAGIGARFLLVNYGERIIQNAIDFAVNKIEGAAKGEKLTVNVGSAVIASAVERIMDLADDDRTLRWVVKLLGGERGVANKVFRKLDLEKAATADKVLTPAVLRLPKGK